MKAAFCSPGTRTSTSLSTEPTRDKRRHFDDAIGLDYKTGVDVDLIVGYDFGMFRLEGELGWKRARLDEIEISDEFADAVRSRCRPRRRFDDVDLDGHVSVFRGMINGLVDFGNEDGFSFYAGGGFGRAPASRSLGDS